MEGQVVASATDLDVEAVVMTRGRTATSAFEDEARSRGEAIKYPAFGLELRGML